MFGLLFWGSLIFGAGIAILGHAGIYRRLGGRGRGTNDHDDSKGLF